MTATIQARVGSTRLPGKVMKDLGGAPTLQRLIERIRRARLVDDILVATTVQSADDAIEDLCRKLEVECFRGSENDVIGRLAQAAREFEVDVNLEVPSDGPLIDPHLIDEVVGYYLKNRERHRYVTNTLPMTYPPGQQLFCYAAALLLEREAELAPDDARREDVEVHFLEQPDRYRLKNLEAPTHYRYPNIFIELDFAEDLEVLQAVWDYFADRPHFSLAQILDFLLAHPEIAEKNAKLPRKWTARLT